MLGVTTVTESPEEFFRRTTTESEAVGEVETQQHITVDTVSVTELGREPSRGFVLPPTGQ